MSDELAVFGGNKAVKTEPGDLFTWPVITGEDEAAVLEVLRRGGMSGTDVTRQFESEFAAWQGTQYALGFHNGTAAIQAAMYGCGIGVGDEIICPSFTYWASVIPVYSLGGTVVFADIDPQTLCIDPDDIEHRIGSRTKAIMAVHYHAHPAEMDTIMKIAARHRLKVIEDVSHAQGGSYKGRKLGTIGDVGAMSMMSGKSFAIGEAGMLATDNRKIYERAVALGHYDRYNESICEEELKPYQGLPLGGYKYRMHQLSSAMGRVQLKSYDERCAEIRRSMNYFWDLLADIPGLHAHRVDESTGSNMAGWYMPQGLYRPGELGGLSVTRYVQAVRAEGVKGCAPGCNRPLHTHGLFQTCDVYGHGKPTRIANAVRDVRALDTGLEVSESVNAMTCSIPWFKKYKPALIEEYAKAYRKAAVNYEKLLADDAGDPKILGKWFTF